MDNGTLTSGNVGDRNAAAATTDGGRDEREKLTTRVDFKALVDNLERNHFRGYCFI